MKIGSFSVDLYTHDGGLVSMGACYYYRIALPLRALLARGYQTVCGISARTGPDGHLQVADAEGWHDDCDVIVMQRWMGQGGAEVVRRARAAGQVVLQDIDDLFWGLPRHHPAFKILDPKRNAAENTDHYRETVKASDGIIVATPFLERYMGRFGPPVYLCRNAVEIASWEPYQQPSRLRVAWIGARKFRAQDLAPLVGVLGPFLAEHGGEFVHIGHVPDVRPVWAELQIPPSVPVEARPLTTIWDYSKAWGGVSLVVVPLENIAFNEAKSWLRGLETAAAGLPFVASDMPEYRELGCGRVARRPREWREQLEELLDPLTRREEGALNRSRAVELSIDYQWTQWADVFAEYGVRAPEPSAL